MEMMAPELSVIMALGISLNVDSDNRQVNIYRGTLPSVVMMISDTALHYYCAFNV
jgi:hypothetical protein